MSPEKVGLVYSEDFALHEPGHIFIQENKLFVEVAGQRLADPFYTLEGLNYPYPLPYGAPHPERPERIALIHASLEALGLLNELELIIPEPVSDHLLETVHSPAYVATARKLAESGGGCLGEGTQ